jgi:hypothetical protein
MSERGIMARIPRQIVDKNGKLTTVHINPDKDNPISPRSFPAPIAAMHENEKWGKYTMWQIAPESKTGYGCPECGVFFSEEERIHHESRENNGECYSCGTFFMNTDSDVAVLPSAIKFFDKDTVRQEKWYHATASNDWHERVKEGREDGNDNDTPAIVHLGTLDAALARAKWMTEFEMPSEKLTWTIHEVVLDPDLPIADEVISDDDFEPRNVAAARINPRYEAEGATRYVNRYEEVGSISLAINAAKLTVIDSFGITKDYQPERDDD